MANTALNIGLWIVQISFLGIYGAYEVYKTFFTEKAKAKMAWLSGENPFNQDDGALIIIIATDTPLLPHQLKRLARRASLGMARTGSLGGNGSGDIFLAFSIANPNAARGNEKGLALIQSLSNNFIDPLLAASVYATEEAIINSMIAAEDMTGRNGLSIKALPHEELRKIMKYYNRLQ